MSGHRAIHADNLPTPAGDHRPARTTIQAAALPAKGLRVEIDCIAYVP
ncbi:MAG TPA: RidA family protein [Vicinamibacterales bacterium]|nr:RidA family protein [Vicinamibacterales bacterium]